MTASTSMFLRVGYYLQMVAAFLLLSLTHYFASAFLPIADCDETYNFIEPIHYLLYGSGKQTWELCPQFALRSWLFSWVYAWPAVMIRGAASLSSADVYFYLRIFNGRIAGLAELFFIYSVWSAFSGRTAMVALMLLLVNYPIHHAAVSVLPTSFVMICNFVVLGCWLRTRSWTACALRKTVKGPASASTPPRHLRWGIALSLFFSIFGGVTGWPFAGLVAMPIGFDLLWRFPKHTILYMLFSVSVVVAAGVYMDTRYYCRWTLSGWNVVAYNVFGGADRGPDLFDVEPWYFFWKNLTLNFHLLFVAVIAAPVVVLCSPQRRFAFLSPTQRISPLEPLRRFVSTEDIAWSGSSAANSASGVAAPALPMTRARLHASSSSLDRRSPLLSHRQHPPQHIQPSSLELFTGVQPGCSRGRELLYMSPFFLWFVFWMLIAHKEERFMSPAYPYMVLAATRALCLFFFPESSLANVNAGDASTISSPISTDTRLSTAERSAFTLRSVSGSSPTPSALSQHGEKSMPNSVDGAPMPFALKWRRRAGLVFLACFFLLSYSRAMAVYTFYSGPERVFYDWYPVLQAEAQKAFATRRNHPSSDLAASLSGQTGAASPQALELSAYYTVCLGREWYRFPSSFFIDHRWARYHFINTSYFHGMLPVSFATPLPGLESGFLTSPSPLGTGTLDPRRAWSRQGACVCGAAGVNDLNREISGQYVPHPTEQCDVIFDSLSPPTHVSARELELERQQRHLDTYFTRSLLNRTALQAVLAASGELYHAVDESYAVMDVDRTPLWCRVLYYPFGISRRCAVWRPLVLNAKA